MRQTRETTTNTIYMITLPDGRRYIGRTNNFKRRQQKYQCRHRDKRCARLVHEAMIEYAWDEIMWTILADNLSISEAKQKEKEFIAALHTREREGGLNGNGGG
jgi:predicted GIY-YIG superfamily endonuclease